MHFHRLLSIVGKGGNWRFLRFIIRPFGEEWASFYLNLPLTSRSAPHYPAASSLPLHTLSELSTSPVSMRSFLSLPPLT